MIRYSHPDEQLSTTELETYLSAGNAHVMLESWQHSNSERSSLGPEHDGADASTAVAVEQQHKPLLAVKLTFQLPPSSYATMLIRELTKRSTSTAHHKALTVEADGLQAWSHCHAAPSERL